MALAERALVAGVEAERIRPLALARERVLPVAPALRALLPDGLQRGSVVTVTGSTRLALLVAAGPSAAGSWAAAVGWPNLGAAAAAEAGIDLGRLALVPTLPRERWPTVVAALLEGVDVVLVGPTGHIAERMSRRLVARARERGSVLVVQDQRAPADVRLAVVTRRWHGLGQGHGHLQRCELEVACWGRGAATRERRAVLAS